MKHNEKFIAYRKEEFIKNSSILYNNKFTYSKVNYVDYKTKVIITCPIHGDFLQVPKGHQMGRGCWKCSRIAAGLSNARTYSLREKPIKRTPHPRVIGSSRNVNHVRFISKAEKLHGTKYDYSKVIYMYAISPVTIICRIHGEFQQTPHDHLRKNGFGGCKTCSQQLINQKITNTLSQFVKSANIKHVNKFNYEKSVYVDQYTDLTANCPTHGDFICCPKAHLRGKGCPKCINITGYGWKRSDFVKRAEGRKALLYVLKCWNDEELFYKIGITLRTIKQRYETKYHMPYKYELFYSEVGDATEIWNKEKTWHRALNKCIYSPKLKFGGSVKECFTNIDVLNIEK